MPILTYNQFVRTASKIIGEIRNTKQKEFLAVVIVDLIVLEYLDSVIGYKKVNQVFKRAAEQLVDSLPKTDLIGYLGRFQLGCLLPRLSSPRYAELAGHKIHRVLSQPFQEDIRQILLSPHVGICLMNDETNLDELMRKANAAKRWAIENKEPIKVYTPDIDTLIKLELDLIMDLDKALEEMRIYLMYQPQLSLTENKIVSAEALIRWTHPVYGAIHPSNLVRVAERTGLISKLTYWVLNTAMRHCAECRKQGIDLGISVNFSPYNLREPDLVDLVSEAIMFWNIPPNKVEIELIETAVVDENPQILNRLYKIQNLGVRIAMDDFGSGFSSLELLGKIPIDTIKIDIQFIRDMLHHRVHGYIVSSIIELAHRLGIIVVAEGVEDKETFDHLKALGCDIIQGFYIARPLTLNDLMKRVKDTF